MQPPLPGPDSQTPARSAFLLMKRRPSRELIGASMTTQLPGWRAALAPASRGLPRPGRRPRKARGRQKVGGERFSRIKSGSSHSFLLREEERTQLSGQGGPARLDVPPPAQARIPLPLRTTIPGLMPRQSAERTTGWAPLSGLSKAPVNVWAPLRRGQNAGAAPAVSSDICGDQRHIDGESTVPKMVQHNHRFITKEGHSCDHVSRSSPRP